MHSGLFSIVYERNMVTAVGYLSYKHYKGATGASTLKKLGQTSSPQQPLSAGLSNLQPQQPQQPQVDASSGQAYTGFAPQSVEAANTAQPQPGILPSQAHSSQAGTYPTGIPQDPPGSVAPSDSGQVSYQSMLGSLPASGDAAGSGSAYTPVHYPNIETEAGQNLPCLPSPATPP